MTWFVRKVGARYELWEAGFWNGAASGPRESLVMPVTGFTAYSPFETTVPTLRYSKN